MYWSSTKRTSSSSQWKLTCSHHDLIAEKLIKLKLTQSLTISFWFLLITGSFYTVYPRHRTLISINKRNTGKTNKEFNLRHDWNSLLSHDESLLLRHYSKEMFPKADVLVKYLNDYKETLGLNVQYNTDVRNIQKFKTDKTVHGYRYRFDDQHDNSYNCSWVLNVMIMMNEDSVYIQSNLY